MLEKYNDMIWFLVGVFTYRAITTVMAYGHMANFVTSVNQQCLKLLGMVAEDVRFSRQLKYMNLEKSDISEENIEEIKQLDERAFSIWKNTSVGLMLTNFPKTYRYLIKYDDWQSAMNELDTIYKDDKKNKK